MLSRRCRVAIFGAILVALVAGCGGPTPTGSAMPSGVQSPSAAVPASPRPETAPPAEPTATPTPSPRALGPGEGDWGRVPFDNGLRDQYGGSLIRAVTAGSTGIVAVGAAATGAAAWTSKDGLTWERATPARDWGRATLSDVVATPTGFVAVGWAGISMDGPLGGTVWTSADGRAWTHVARGIGSSLNSIAAQGDALYAVVFDDELGGSIGRSDDGGRTWNQVTGLPEMSINAIATGPDTMVAGGSRFIDGGDGRWESAIFSSRDGLTWVPAIVAPIEGDIRAITWSEGRFVAVGTGGMETGDAAAWASPDGETWTRAPQSPVFAGNGRGVWLAAVAGTGDGRVVAVGPGPDGHAGLWFSDDGLAWALAPTPDQVEAFEGRYEPVDVVTVNGRVVVVGSYPDPPRKWSAAVWTNPAPSPTASPSPIPAACPGRHPDLLALAELTPEQRHACYGSKSLTFRAFVAPNLIGDGEYVIPEPAWLNRAGWCAHPVEGDRSLLYCLELHAKPRSRVARSLPREDGSGMAPGAWLWVTGRVDDPAAEACPLDARAQCQQALVVTRVRAAKAP